MREAKTRKSRELCGATCLKKGNAGGGGSMRGRRRCDCGGYGPAQWRRIADEVQRVRGNGGERRELERGAEQGTRNKGPRFSKVPEKKSGGRRGGSKSMVVRPLEAAGIQDRL